MINIVPYWVFSSFKNIHSKKNSWMKYGWPIFEISLSDFTSLDLRNPP